MLIVAPIGRTNLDTLSSTLFLSSRHSIVTGSVAELDEVPNATQIDGKLNKSLECH